MQYEVITFDCAHTLMDARWDPAQLAIDCAEYSGFPVHRSDARSAYRALLAERWPHYVELNLTRDHALVDQFWVDLCGAWVEAIDLPRTAVEPLLARADVLLFGPDSAVFPLYEDVVPALTALQERGQRMAVISNWDVTLHKALAMHDLTRFFEVRIASLEWGPEKPDARLFHLTLEQLGVEPGQALHVGDNPLDDVQGARNAGMAAVLIDRNLEGPRDGQIHRLTDLLKLTGGC